MLFWHIVPIFRLQHNQHLRIGVELLNSLSEMSKKKIRQCSKKADVIVVSMHWGVDFTDYPLLFQMKYAREMIDSGADLILGHHPHNIQGIEKYQNGIIVYSLGDFVFDGSGRDTFIFKCEISKSGIKKHELIPAIPSLRHLLGSSSASSWRSSPPLRWLRAGRGWAPCSRAMSRRNS